MDVERRECGSSRIAREDTALLHPVEGRKLTAVPQKGLHCGVDCKKLKQNRKMGPQYISVFLKPGLLEQELVLLREPKAMSIDN